MPENLETKISEQGSLTYRAYHTLFKETMQGKTVLADMMKAHHVFDSTFSSKPLEMAFREGERNVVLRILTILDISPEEAIGLVERR